ncbi:GIY-YIG catalytic domain-containing endonuclease [Acanthocystis turfacea Chlorella virus Can0610SP]|nr:GIY-YIG catalytic domain-containing endonuclease [Acanthocystis turfacea Chlorella virus Can0610SP]
MGFVYRLTSPSNKSYVGQTIRPIKERFNEHQTKTNCVLIYRAIQFHGWHNMKKEWIEVPDDELNFYEEMLVTLLGTIAPDGYNLREGGESGGKMSEEVKKKLSVAHTGKTLADEHKQKISQSMSGENNPMFGQTHTEETKIKMSDKRKGEDHPMYRKTHTDDAKQKMSVAHSGKNNPLSKKVYQYDLDGTFVKLFASCGEAARSLNKNDGTCIRQCAIGKRPTMYGFKWSYTEL